MSFSIYLLSSQVPQGFNYQAVAHNSTGVPIASTNIQVKIGILSDTLTPIIIWEELHSSVKTNATGVFNLVIGTGTKQSGSAATFSAINWSKTPLYLKVQINYLGAWKYMGTSRLWSVPYSMVASELEGSVNNLEVVGEDETSDEALFEVRRKDGHTMFAVYNHGVRIYMPLDTVSKSKKGGFAIGGFGQTKDEIQDYFVVNPDSIRAYIDTNAGKTRKGGFAIGGFGTIKAPGEEYLRVTRDSTRVYLNDTGTKTRKGGFAIGSFNQTKQGIQDYLLVSPDSVRIFINDTTSIKTRKGGFAIGGFGTLKAPGEEYLRVTRDSTRIYINEPTKGLKGGFAIGSINPTTPNLIEKFTALVPDNYFIGHRSGNNNTTGIYNSFIGYEAGFKNTTGSQNVLMGYQSGYSNINGSYNVLLGYQAGFNTIKSKNAIIGYHAGFNAIGSNNILIGDSTGFSTTGSYNVIIGNEAGKLGSSGYTTLIGFQAGYQTKGNWNVMIGNRVGQTLVSGSRSVIIGSEAAAQGTGGYNNVIIGSSAGRNIGTSDNVMIGNDAGKINTNGSQNIFIGSGCGASSTGSENIFLGYQTGSGATGSHNIYIGNYVDYSSTNSYELVIDDGGGPQPLIFGNMYNGRLVIHGRNNNNTNNRTFFVNGTAGGTSAWYNDSDRRLKHNIITISDALQKVLRLRGVTFCWNDTTKGITGLQMGFIGQEAVNIVPEVVSVTNDHYTIQYAPITALLVEAIKEQQTQIESYKSENNDLKSQLQSLQQEVEQI